MNKETLELLDEKIPNGVFFIEDVTTEKTECRNYILLTPDTVAAPPATKYIGVKMGDRAIAVALRDIPGNKDGELQLLPRNHKSPANSEHYSYDCETGEHRFNVYEDFDGKGNTERLKAAGCTIPLGDGEWIPSMGEIGLLMMNLTAINKALELAGGQPLKLWHWSSTERSARYTWIVYFSNGSTYGNNIKCYSYAVRAVAAF